MRGPVAGQRHVREHHVEARGSTWKVVTHVRTLSYSSLWIGLGSVRVGNQHTLAVTVHMKSLR